MPGCLGHCCENFSLPYSKEQLAHAARMGQVFNHSKDEAKKLAKMVIPIYGNEGHFTCIFFDPQTRKCLNYENRPVVCRIYPDFKCENKDCLEPGTRKSVEKLKENLNA